MADLEGPQINMSSIRVAGVGGLGMVAVILIIAFVMPAVRWFVIVGVAGGIIGGLAFIAYRRWVKSDPPHGPTLMVDLPAVTDAKPGPASTHTPAKLSPVTVAK